MVKLAKPSHAQNPQDPITCTTWITPKDDSKKLLCCGTGLSYLLLWKQREPTTEFEEIMARWIGTGREIMAISCDTSEIGTWVLTGTWDRCVQVWVLDSRHNLLNIFSVELPATVLHVVYTHDTELLYLVCMTGKCKSSVYQWKITDLSGPLVILSAAKMVLFLLWRPQAEWCQ